MKSLTSPEPARRISDMRPLLLCFIALLLMLGSRTNLFAEGVDEPCREFKMVVVSPPKDIDFKLIIIPAPKDLDKAMVFNPCKQPEETVSISPLVIQRRETNQFSKPILIQPKEANQFFKPPPFEIRNKYFPKGESVQP
jgi:hypothetical protein